MEEISTTDFAHHFPLIAKRMNANDLVTLINAMTIEHVPEGKEVIRDVGINHSLYLVFEGSLSCFITHEKETISMGTISTGQCFGELSMLDSEASSMSVVAESDCTLLVLSRDAFFDLDIKHPVITGNLLHVFSDLMLQRIQTGEAILYNKFAPEGLEQASQEGMHPVEWASRIYQRLHGNEEMTP